MKTERTIDEKIQAMNEFLKDLRDASRDHYRCVLGYKDRKSVGLEFAIYRSNQDAYEKFCKIFGIKEEK